MSFRPAVYSHDSIYPFRVGMPYEYTNSSGDIITDTNIWILTIMTNKNIDRLDTILNAINISGRPNLAMTIVVSTQDESSIISAGWNGTVWAGSAADTPIPNMTESNRYILISGQDDGKDSLLSDPILFQSTGSDFWTIFGEDAKIYAGNQWVKNSAAVYLAGGEEEINLPADNWDAPLLNGKSGTTVLSSFNSSTGAADGFTPFTFHTLGATDYRPGFTLNPYTRQTNAKIISNEERSDAVLLSGGNNNWSEASSYLTFEGAHAAPDSNSTVLFKHHAALLGGEEGELIGEATWSQSGGFGAMTGDSAIGVGNTLHVYFDEDTRDSLSWIKVSSDWNMQVLYPKAIALTDSAFGHVETPAGIGRTSDWSGGNQRAYIIGDEEDATRWDSLKDTVGNKITITDGQEHHNGTYDILAINDSGVARGNIIYDLNPSSSVATGFVTHPSCRFKIHGINQRMPLNGFA